jgi:hypothetical protein
MVYNKNHRNWAILRGDNDWILIDKSVLAPVQLIRSVPSIVSSDRERYEMARYKQLQIKLDWI